MAWGTPTNIGIAVDAAGATAAITVPAGGVPAGALIVLVVYEISNTAAVGTVADTAVNAYVNVPGASPNALQTNGWGRLFYVKNSLALVQNNTITYTKAVTASQASISAFYVTGGDTTAPLDTAVTATATGSSVSPSVTSGTPSVAGELFVAFQVSKSATYTQDSGHNWAEPPNAELPGAGQADIDGGNQVNAGTGTIIFAPTITSSPWAAIVVGFKVSTAAAIVVGRIPPEIFSPLSGPNRGLTPTRAYPDDPFAITLAIGRTPPRIFRPFAGPTRGLRPTQAFPPPQHRVPLDAATFIFTGQASTRAIGAAIAKATFTLTGNANTRAITAAIAKATFTITGNGNTRGIGWLLSKGTFILTGLGNVRDRPIALGKATFTLTGQANTRAIGAALGKATFTLTGQANTRAIGWLLSKGTFIFTGGGNIRGLAFFFTLGKATFVLTGGTTSRGLTFFFTLGNATYLVAAKPNLLQWAQATKTFTLKPPKTTTLAKDRATAAHLATEGGTDRLAKERTSDAHLANAGLPPTLKQTRITNPGLTVARQK